MIWLTAAPGREESIIEVRVEKEDDEREKVLEMSIDELELSVRSYNCLKRAGINTGNALWTYLPNAGQSVTTAVYFLPYRDEPQTNPLALPSADNCLKRAGINTVEELCNRTSEDMMKVRNLGMVSSM